MDFYEETWPCNVPGRCRFNPCFTGLWIFTDEPVTYEFKRELFQSLFYWIMDFYTHDYRQVVSGSLRFNPCFTGLWIFTCFK